MIKFYSKYNQHYVAIDCIIFGFDYNELKILLIKRDFEPGKGEWSLMGGFLDKQESLDNGAYRILRNLTGIENIFLEQFHTFGEIERDPGARVLSVAYYALIKTDQYDLSLQGNHSSKWFSLNNMPPLIFDHSNMIKLALEHLRKEIKLRPIGFELLPKKFTIPQLQKLYESIYLKQLDKRNFRKKILSMQILKKTDEKDKEFSKKGAYLYKFDIERYKQLQNNGFLFDI
jgi:ADP-ribose pyrophosphatase YjhB (NUDIX family)